MKKNLKFVSASLLVLMARLVPFNWIVGSLHATFSWASIIAPVIAEQYGLGWISLFFLFNGYLLSASFFSVSSLSLFIIRRLPLFLAGRVFQKREFFTSILVPAACMILFWCHEVGRAAWCYSLYWFIPMVLFAMENSRWNRALSSAFVAHAIGSVIWLYTAKIPIFVWIGLIPVVLIERLLIAGGILLCNYLVELVTHGIASIKFSKQRLWVVAFMGLI